MICFFEGLLFLALVVGAGLFLFFLGAVLLPGADVGGRITTPGSETGTMRNAIFPPFSFP